MKITIENTTQIVEIKDPLSSFHIQARVWEGTTETGIKVTCLIPRIAAQVGENLEQFEKELTETRAPEMGPLVFPLRMIL